MQPNELPLMAIRDLRDHAGLVPLSGGKRTFELDVCFRVDFVRFRPGSGRSRGPCRTFAADPPEPIGVTIGQLANVANECWGIWLK